MKCSLGISNFPLFLCTDHWGRLSYLSLLFFGTLCSGGYILLFLLCLLLLSFSQLFVRPPQTTILPFCISFSWGWSWSLPLVQCHKPLPIALCRAFQNLGHPDACASLLHFSVNLISPPQLLLPHQADAMLNNCWWVFFVFFLVKYHRDKAVCTGQALSFWSIKDKCC